MEHKLLTETELSDIDIDMSLILISSEVKRSNAWVCLVQYVAGLVKFTEVNSFVSFHIKKTTGVLGKKKCESSRKKLSFWQTKQRLKAAWSFFKQSFWIPASAKTCRQTAKPQSNCLYPTQNLDKFTFPSLN